VDGDQRPSVTPNSGRRHAATAALALLVAASAAVRYAGGRDFELPWIAPDESIYALLGRSLWETGSWTLLGAEAWGYSFLYPALVGGPLSLAGVELGVELVQALQAVAMSATAVVVYLWGRRPLGPGWALVAAALAVVVPGLTYSSLVMTEALSYPLTALALFALAAAVTRPTPLRQALVLGSIALALATHVRAAALVPALFLAVALQCGFERGWQPARRQAGLLVATAIAAAGLLVGFALAGRWSDVFGAYAAAAGGYEADAAVADVVWHFAGTFVLVAGIPLVALALELRECVRGREPDPAARALVATAAAWTAAVVLEVGIFASRWVDHIAERDLLTLAPPLFLVFGLWLRRGLPRAGVGAKLLALVVAAPAVLLPIGRFATPEAALDAFTFIPLERLAARTSTATLELAFPLVAAALVAAAMLVPRRARAVLAALVAVVLAGLSIAATREIERLTRLDRAWIFDTGDPRWLDAVAEGHVTYLHGSAFPAGVWKHAFWNERLEAVAAVDGAAPLDPLDPVRVSVAADGRLRASGRLDGELVAAPAELALAGERLAVAPRSAELAGLALWRPERPLRIEVWRAGFHPNGDIAGIARVSVYRCGPGRLELTLLGKQGTPVELRADGLTVARPEIAPGAVWDGTIPAPADADGRSPCVFEVVSPGLLGSTRLEFVRE
jgi:hypothetical protein